VWPLASATFAHAGIVSFPPSPLMIPPALRSLIIEGPPGLPRDPRVVMHLVAGPPRLPVPGPDVGHRASHDGRLPGGPPTLLAGCRRVAAGLARGPDGVGVQRPRPRPHRADRRGTRNERLLPSLPGGCPRRRPGTRCRLVLGACRLS